MLGELFVFSLTYEQHMGNFCTTDPIFNVSFNKHRVIFSKEPYGILIYL